MDEFEQSDLENNTCYQNAIHYEEKENAFIKNCKGGLFSLVCVIKLEGSMTR